MVSLEQWRAAIGSFACLKLRRSGICEGCVRYDCMVMICLMVYTSIVAMLLIVSGNVELNPGPYKTCPNITSLGRVSQLAV